jgi:preprotein translocase subunit Sec61beta
MPGSEGRAQKPIHLDPVVLCTVAIGVAVAVYLVIAV